IDKAVDPVDMGVVERTLRFRVAGPATRDQIAIDGVHVIGRSGDVCEIDTGGLERVGFSALAENSQPSPDRPCPLARWRSREAYMESFAGHKLQIARGGQLGRPVVFSGLLAALLKDSAASLASSRTWC